MKLQVYIFGFLTMKETCMLNSKDNKRWLPSACIKGNFRLMWLFSQLYLYFILYQDIYSKDLTQNLKITLVCRLGVQLVFKVSYVNVFGDFFPLYLNCNGEVIPNICVIYVFNHSNCPMSLLTENIRCLHNGVLF